jgi:hypothetical protein
MTQHTVFNSRNNQMVACFELPWHFYLGDMTAYNFQHIIDDYDNNHDTYYLFDDPSIHDSAHVHVSVNNKTCLSYMFYMRYYFMFGIYNNKKYTIKSVYSIC